MARISISDEQLSRLTHVPTEGLKAGRFYFPDFLVVGPQRTGSTWLHRNIDAHPEIFLSPRKEMHYFNGVGRESAEIHDNLRSQRFDLYSRDFSPSLVTYVRKNVFGLHYGKSLRSLQLNPMKMFNARQRGELTASYAAMEMSRIQDICILNPDVKAVLFLRHPVERAWSHAKLHARGLNRRIDQIDEAEIEQLLSSDYFFKCGSYSQIIRNWHSCLASDTNLHVELYDNISTEPGAVLTRLYQFLGVSASASLIDEASASARINATEDAMMPERFHELLTTQFKQEIQFCKANYSASW